MNKTDSRFSSSFQGLLCAMLMSLVFIQGASAEVNVDHHQDYLAALDKVTRAQTRILEEMERIQFGAVAHYDFLQYEHIELLRHARALAWAPSDVAVETRAALRTDAESLLVSATAMEWVIADFLRATAQLRSAASNTLDIAATLQADAPAALQEKLQKLETQTRLFMAAGYSSDFSPLAIAFDAVMAENIGQQPQRELLFQKQQMLQNAPLLLTQRQKLVTSDVQQLARRLQARYES